MSDVPMFVTSEQTSSERRISPSWSISQLKVRLEPITGIPPSSQKIRIHGSTSGGSQYTPITDEDEDNNKLIGSYNLVPYGRIHVEDTRPPGSQLDINDMSRVEKYIMPEQEYSNREDSVLSWKKRNQLGRFDPNATSTLEEQDRLSKDLVQERSITVGKRCQVSSEPTGSGGGHSRKGLVKYVGEVPEISIKGNTNVSHRIWVGVEFDEPLGKNDGSIAGTRYFDAKPLYGSFIKPELVEVGDFPEDLIDDDEEDEL